MITPSAGSPNHEKFRSSAKTPVSEASAASTRSADNRRASLTPVSVPLSVATERGTEGVRSVAQLLAPRKLLQPGPVEDLGYVDAALGVAPDSVRAPELARVVAALRTVASHQVAFQVHD